MADEPDHPTTDIRDSGENPEITYDPQEGWTAFRLCIGGQDFLIDPDQLEALGTEVADARTLLG